MTEREIINLLKNMGIVHDSEGGLQLSSVSDVTFINNDTGKQFKYEVNSEGELVGNEVITNTLTNKLNELAKTGRGISTTSSFRGFIARLLCADATDSKITATYGKDVGIYADRVAIAGVYCPLSTDTKFGCTHGFIEIANVSHVDIPLDGCYLHYLHPASESGYITEHLPLKGAIKAGSTYLVRCKKYANAEIRIYVDGSARWECNGRNANQLEKELHDIFARMSVEQKISFVYSVGEQIDRFLWEPPRLRGLFSLSIPAPWAVRAHLF